ncbi:hypothetical protein SAMN04487943_101338 [Gracilibacillus orientalis]|uniref:Uncharacterized protein n=2 Tax=Gracilibacillus orientalis TaxID=334253 RepID=A0A1I4HBP8_9BACI|nr:hypothetical protein SAMN04487943_101338 [Gracilibacillus orientalis]
MIDLIHRFNSIKRSSVNQLEKIDSLNRLISDMEEAFEIPTDDSYAMREFKKNNEFLFNFYMEVKDQREVTADAMVTY